MKKFLFILLCFACSSAYAGSFISITSPNQNAVSTAQQLIEGKVEETFIKSLKLTVEPFLFKAGLESQQKKIVVKDGTFAERVTLPPGLNLIRVGTLNSAEESVKPVFLLSKDRKLLGDTKEWGSNSKIFILTPQEAKTTNSKITFKGVVTDNSMKNLDAVIFHAEDISSAVGTKSGIQYKKLLLNNQQFIVEADLKEGLNILLLKEYGKSVQPDSLQIKSIIYEKISPEVTLNEPELKNNKLNISGNAKNGSSNKIRIKISALVEDYDKPGVVYQHVIFDKEIFVKSDGTFLLAVPWEIEKVKYVIKSLPTIYAYCLNGVVTKTLVKWR